MVNLNKTLILFKNCGVSICFYQIKYIFLNKLGFYKNDNFDIRYGTNVNEFIASDQLYINENYHAYKATNAYFFHSLMKIITKYFNLNLKKTIIIDVGSGKGKVLLMSLKYPFYKIIGLEYSNTLFESSKKNVSLFSKKFDTNHVELYEMDATLFLPSKIIPNKTTIYFIYNSFSKILRESNV